MERKFAYYGNPILRQKTSRVEGIDDALREMVEEMKALIIKMRGSGLAAPQIGESLSLFITRVNSEEQAKRGETPQYRIYLNPKILKISQETVTHPEACLSIPGIKGPVTRPVAIDIEATNMEGERFEERLVGWEARVFLHENDHLNGVLYIDRLSPVERKKLEPFLKSLKKKTLG